MAKKDNGKEPGFWRGYLWGILWTPLIVSGVGVALSIPLAIIAAAAGRQVPGAKYWKGDDVPPPEPIDVEVR